MSDILDLYNKSTKIHVQEARNIPKEEVNFIDQKNEFQTGWTNEQPPLTTTFTDEALSYFDIEKKNLVIPTSFQPTEAGIALDRWSPDHGYYNPGSPQT